LATTGHLAFDSGLKKEVLVMSVVNCFMADSPMAAEITNTPNPGKANNPCRICHLRVDKADDRHSIEYVQQFFGCP
jgi:hypothetical protein